MVLTKVVGYTVPGILIILGWSTVMGGTLISLIGVQGNPVILGYGMLITGILLYAGRLIFGI